MTQISTGKREKIYGRAARAATGSLFLLSCHETGDRRGT